MVGRMRFRLPLAVLLIAASPPPTATVAEIEAAAPTDAWRAVEPGNLLLIDTAKGTVAIDKGVANTCGYSTYYN